MTITAAYRAACATASPSAAIIDTVEIHHTSWPSVIRLAQNNADITGTLESTAPRNPSTAVTFSAFPCRIDPPRTGDGNQDMSISVSNATRLLMDNIDGTDYSAANPITVIWRRWVTTDMTQPAMTPLVLTVKSVSITAAGVSMTCGLSDFTNRRFPRVPYTDAAFPGLAPRV